MTDEKTENAAVSDSEPTGDLSTGETAGGSEKATQTASKQTASKPRKRAAKAPAKKTKTATKKSNRPVGETEVKVIQSLDYRPGRDTGVYFTDGTKAVIKAGGSIPGRELMTPNLVKVTLSRGEILSVEGVDTGGTGE